jgi:quercetin dioxygenase-like cupin family protein
MSSTAPEPPAPFLTQVKEGESLPRLTSRFVVRATGERTGGAFTLVESSRLPIGDGPSLHEHTREDETFIVLSGRYRFYIGEQTLEGAAGSVAFAPKRHPHRFEALDDDCRLLHLFIPGGIDDYFRQQRTDMSNAELHCSRRASASPSSSELTYQAPPA